MKYKSIYSQSKPWEDRWLSNPLPTGLSSSLHLTTISSPGLNSLKWAILPSSSTSSMTWSNLATVSTSNDANAANGSASANSKLVMAILLNVGLNILLSPTMSFSLGVKDSVALAIFWSRLLFHSSRAQESVLKLDMATFVGSFVKGNKLGGVGFWLSRVGLRKSRGWDFKAVSRSCNASWRWFERIDGEQWRLFFMLFESSIRTFETSAASRMQGSLNNARTAFGVYMIQEGEQLLRRIGKNK